jgi:hypothetical protein
MSGLETIGLIAGLAGTAVSAVGAIQQGEAAQEAANAQAAAAERRAGEERAAATRDAARKAQQTALLLSRQQALAAASGGGATDSTVLGLMGDVAKEGRYQQDISIYQGDSKATNLEDEAALQRWKGQQARTAGYINAGSSVLNGVSSFSKFWSKTPSSGVSYRDWAG